MAGKKGEQMKTAFVKRGVSDCKIVIPENAHVIEQTAAEELVNYFEKALDTVRNIKAVIFVLKLKISDNFNRTIHTVSIGHIESAAPAF